MKKILAFLLAAVLCAAAAAKPVPARAESPAQAGKADWTVLCYVCGADLESRYGLASEDLSDILDCMYYWDSRQSVENIMREYMGEDPLPVLREPDRVKVAVQTGGSRRWHSQKTGVSIAADRLQRWEFVIDDSDPDLYPVTRFELKEELPLASMAVPETLSDFIRWGTENYPAEKYCLMIWGHGGGSKTGVLIDELFDGDRMNLTELKQSLNDSGVVFETILFDACMMATLETACAVQENARWMVASEEVVTGQGTDVGNWLQQLYYHPECDGRELGRWICDMTEILYANSTDKQAQDLLTWSVVDLSKIPRLAAAFDRFMENIGDIYANDSWLMYSVLSMLENTEKYGESFEGMVDLGGIFFSRRVVDCIDAELFRENLTALDEAVIYTVRGNGRSAARGLSFCYAPDFSNTELDVYTASCPFRHYLALLDALSPTWSAPDEIYETVARLPKLGDIPDYAIHVEKTWSQDGLPGISVDALNTSVRSVEYSLYRLSEETGSRVFLGSNVTRMDPTGGTWLYTANEPWMWPCVEGETCSIELLSDTVRGGLFSIPIQIGTEFWNLRCGYDGSRLELYGLWEGYDTDSSVMNRNVMQLSGFSGRPYRLLFPIDSRRKDDLSGYECGSQKVMYRNLDMTIEPLPAGTYFLEYRVQDIFMHPIPLTPVEFRWDGTKISFPESTSWEGSMDLKWEGWPEDRKSGNP